MMKTQFLKIKELLPLPKCISITMEVILLNLQLVMIMNRKVQKDIIEGQKINNLMREIVML